MPLSVEERWSIQNIYADALKDVMPKVHEKFRESLESEFGELPADVQVEVQSGSQMRIAFSNEPLSGSWVQGFEFSVPVLTIKETKPAS